LERDGERVIEVLSLAVALVAAFEFELRSGSLLPREDPTDHEPTPGFGPADRAGAARKRAAAERPGRQSAHSDVIRADRQSARASDPRCRAAGTATTRHALLTVTARR
jgi:hypothetical protein